MSVQEWAKECGCVLKWERQAENCVMLLAQTCPVHEAIIVLSKKGDKGTLGQGGEGL